MSLKIKMWLHEKPLFRVLLLATQLCSLTVEGAVAPRTGSTKRYASPFLNAKTESKLTVGVT